MRRVHHVLAVLFLALVLVPANATEAAVARDPYRYFFNETWGNLPEELENARAAGKQAIMLFFEMDECPYCHYMKTTVLNQPRVQEYFRKHFLLFPIDIEGDIEMTNFRGEVTTQKEFAFREFRVRATPVIAFFDLDGKLIYRHIGKTRGVSEFMLMGEYIATGKYKEMPYVRFKRQKKKAARR